MAIHDGAGWRERAGGPTGSGRTTTLYAALAHLNTTSRKIITIEDPVEYNLPGMQQIQVQDEIGPGLCPHPARGAAA